MGGAGSFIKNLVVIMALGLAAMGCSGGGAALKKDNPDVLAKLQKLDVKDGGDFTTVVALFDRPVIHNTVRLSDPPKLMVDLAGVDLGGYNSRMEVDKGLVSYIIPSRVSNTKRLARLEVGLNSDSNYKIVQDGNTLSILFEKNKEVAKKAAAPVEPTPAAVSQPLAAASAEPVKAAVAPVAPAPAKTVITVDRAEEKPAAARAAVPGAVVSRPAKPVAETAKKDMPEATRVEKITFTKGGGSYQVNIAGNGKFSTPKLFMLGTDRLVLDLPGMSSVKEKDSIEVGGVCLKRVRMASHAGDGEKKVRVVLDLTGAVDYDVKGDGKTLVLTVAPAGVKAASRPAVKPDAVAAAKTEPAKASKPADSVKIFVSREEGRTVLSSAPAAVSAGPATAGDKPGEYVETPSKIYTGGKISFDVQNADLDKVIKLLADVAGLNLIIDPNEVKGKVSLKLDNVPWDQALDILLKIYNLDRVLEGNVLRVAPKSKLDDEKKRELQLITEKNKLQEDAEEVTVRMFKLNNAKPKDQEGLVKKILSKRGDVSSDDRTNTLIVTDTKANLDKVEKLIRVLDKGVSQIMIEARIVEVDVTYSQNLGISWGLQQFGGEHNHKITSGPNSSLLFKETLKDANGDEFQYNDYVLAVPETLGNVGGVAGNFLWGGLADNINIDLTVQALESIGKAEMLSAPKVMTLENQAASIVSGETIYVQSTTASGSAPMPLNANLSLTVTPRLIGEDLIFMDVIATNNSASATVPAGAQAAINTKSVTTKVTVKDGNTVVLGGVYTKQDSLTDAQVPWLGRIPLLGWLFKTRDIARPTMELLIFITPKIVHQPGEV